MKPNMKRFILVAAMLIAAMAAADAQSGFGIKAGVNFPTRNVKDLVDASPASYQFGIAYNVDLPFGLSIQPALQYNLKQSTLDFSAADTDASDVFEKVSVGYLEFMASLQWGVDLIVVRPFLDVSPYIGYALNGNFGSVADLWKSDGVNRLDYGVGLGAGLDIWKFQAVCRYTWNFGNLMDTAGNLNGDLKEKYQAYKDIKSGKFGGLTVTLAYFF